MNFGAKSINSRLGNHMNFSGATDLNHSEGNTSKHLMLRIIYVNITH